VWLEAVEIISHGIRSLLVPRPQMYKVQVKRRNRMFAHVLDLLEVGKHIRRLWRAKLLQKGGKRKPDLDVG
jgi:predicted glycosyltransferase